MPPPDHRRRQRRIDKPARADPIYAKIDDQGQVCTRHLNLAFDGFERMLSLQTRLEPAEFARWRDLLRGQRAFLIELAVGSPDLLRG